MMAHPGAGDGGCVAAQRAGLGNPHGLRVEWEGEVVSGRPDEVWPMGLRDFEEQFLSIWLQAWTGSGFSPS